MIKKITAFLLISFISLAYISPSYAGVNAESLAKHLKKIP